MTEDLTRLLERWSAGEAKAEPAVMSVLYPLLRGLVQRQLGVNDGLTMQPTELVHEAYMRLLEQRRVDWDNRAQFFAIVGRVVRRVVIDYLRERQAIKRGVGQEHVPIESLSETELPHVAQATDWLQIEHALAELETFDPAGARLVEQRYFAGLGVTEIAQINGVSEATIARQWRAVRAWLEVRLADLARH